jgi:hypothetical protein
MSLSLFVRSVFDLQNAFISSLVSDLFLLNRATKVVTVWLVNFLILKCLIHQNYTNCESESAQKMSSTCANLLTNLVNNSYNCIGNFFMINQIITT